VYNGDCWTGDMRCSAEGPSTDVVNCKSCCDRYKSFNTVCNTSETGYTCYCICCD
jgi:hypothetical protein